MRKDQISPAQSLSTLLLLAFVLLGSPVAYAQESARDRVDALRGHLAQAESIYAESLADSATNQSAAIKVDRLRADLRAKLETLFDRLTSHDATLAVHRADVDATLDAIRAYEQTLVTHGTPGEGTTFTNVLSDEQLVKMRSQIQSGLDVLIIEQKKSLPHDAGPLLEFRIRELDAWQRALAFETDRRKMIGQVRLKTIPAGITTEDARTRYAAIGKADGNGRLANFQERLALQVHLRLHTAPEDASLALLRDQVPITKPPFVPTSEARGPPKSIEEAFVEFRSAKFAEAAAVTNRDDVAIARARAKLTANRQWLRLALRDRPTLDQSGFSQTSNTELVHLREQWRNWHANLLKEQQATALPKTSVAVEIKDAKSQIDDLDAVLQRRLLIPPPEGGDFGPSTSGEGKTPPPSTPEIRALNRTWERQLAETEMTELLRRTDPRPLPDPTLNTAASRAFHRRITAEAQLIRSAYDETVVLKCELIVLGRGQSALDGGHDIQRARDLLQSAAQDLRTSLADPRFARHPEASTVLKSLSDIPAPKGSAGVNNLENGLIALEKARDAARVAVQPRGLQIQAVINSTAVVDPAYRISLPPMPVQTGSRLQIKRLTDYDTLYRQRQTLKELLKDPKRAPGGVIVDAKLPAELGSRLKRLEVDISSGAIKVLLDDSWRPLKARQDPLLARLAWAFVLDEQIAVMDLRPLDNDEAVFLVRQYGKRELSESARNKSVSQLADLTSVNVNNALRDTPLVTKLIAADQLMFDLLPRSATAIVGEDTRYGLPLRELRRAFQADAAEALNRPDWQDVLFNKSVVAVSEISHHDGPQLVLSPKFSFYLFGVTAKGSNAIELKASREWFAAHEDKLKTLDQLAPLAEFATLVALFRTVHQQSIPHNLDDLIMVPLAASQAPRFIVRRDRIQQRNWLELQKSLSGRE